MSNDWIMLGYLMVSHSFPEGKKRFSPRTRRLHPPVMIPGPSKRNAMIAFFPFPICKALKRTPSLLSVPVSFLWGKHKNPGKGPLRAYR
jgi:hypothetical protein